MHTKIARVHIAPCSLVCKSKTPETTQGPSKGWTEQWFIHGMRNADVKTRSRHIAKAIHVFKTCLGYKQSCVCKLMPRQNLEKGSRHSAEDARPAQVPGRIVLTLSSSRTLKPAIWGLPRGSSTWRGALSTLTGALTAGSGVRGTGVLSLALTAERWSRVLLS